MGSDRRSAEGLLAPLRAGYCGRSPNRYDWQGLVRPALLLVSLHRHLLERLAFEQDEREALQPLGGEGVAEGLVALLRKLSE
jgi:hypothetical protein